MAKTAGGIRGGKSKNASTEKGYSEKMKRNILGTERAHRTQRDETLHVFNEKGDKIKSIGGKGARVEFRGKLPENAILTHNHPRAIGAKGIAAIGNSFSGDDILSAVSQNAKEIRAVTPTYTFSMKRPRGGWGASSKEVAKSFNSINQQVKKEFSSYVDKQGYSDTSIARAQTRHYHEVMKRMAQKFGWIYTKKRG